MVTVLVGYYIKYDLSYSIVPSATTVSAQQQHISTELPVLEMPGVVLFPGSRRFRSDFHAMIPNMPRGISQYLGRQIEQSRYCKAMRLIFVWTMSSSNMTSFVKVQGLKKVKLARSAGRRCVVAGMSGK